MKVMLKFMIILFLYISLLGAMDESPSQGKGFFTGFVNSVGRLFTKKSYEENPQNAELLARLLTEHSDDEDDECRRNRPLLSLLHYAILDRNMMFFQSLLTTNNDVNEIDGSGKAPLHVAAGACTRLVNDDGSISYFVHTASNHTQCADADDMQLYVTIATVLLDNGAIIDLTEKSHRMTPLHAAAHAGNIEMIKLLLSRGANPNNKDDLGLTALHIVVEEHGDIEMVALLLDYGADVYAMNEAGHTPLYLAQHPLKYVQELNPPIVHEQRQGVIALLENHVSSCMR